MGFVKAIVKLGLAAVKHRRAARRAGKVFRKELVRLGIEKKMAERLAVEYESRSMPSLTNFI
jgi:hypothetical protein